MAVLNKINFKIKIYNLNTLRDRAKQIKFWDPMVCQWNIFEHFENFVFKIWKYFFKNPHKFALISETVRYKEKRMKFGDHIQLYWRWWLHNILEHFRKFQNFQNILIQAAYLCVQILILAEFLCKFWFGYMPIAFFQPKLGLICKILKILLNLDKILLFFGKN